MEVKVVVSVDDRTAGLLNDLIQALAWHQGKLFTKAPEEPKKAKEEVIEQPTAPIQVEAPKEKESEDLAITKDDIRNIARELADAGRQGEYKPILEKYGYKKVNEIQEEDLLAIYTEMTSLKARA